MCVWCVAAYKQADGRKVDGRRIVVDVERGRTVPGWRPRRLGGGLGSTRTGAELVNQVRRKAGGLPMWGPLPICCMSMIHCPHMPERFPGRRLQLSAIAAREVVVHIYWGSGKYGDGR